MVLCLGFFYSALAWTEPAQTPPNGNTPTPLNVGPNYQTKTGVLQIKNPDANGSDNADGNWFHIGGYTKTFDQAKAACVAQSARLAYYSEIVDAFKSGANSCSWGWISEGFVVYPMQNGAGAGCGGAVGGVRVIYPALTSTYGAYCARDSLIVNGSSINGGNLYAKGIYLNSGQSGGQMYLGLLANGQNADKLGICLGGVCKTDWNQTGYWQDGGNGKIYYNGGNVGIGTANPTTAKLVISPGGQPAIDVGSQSIVNLNVGSGVDTNAATIGYVKSMIGGGGGGIVNAHQCNADGVCETQNISAVGNITATGNLTVSGSAQAAKFDGAYVPRYQTWVSQGRGEGGAAIYNDNGSYDALMIVGNDQGLGYNRWVRVWDSLWANIRIDAPIYYDSSNAGYYVDPNGTSVLNGLTAYGPASFTQPVSVGTPTAPSHAVTKSYLESALSGGGGGGIITADNSKACSADGVCETNAISAVGGITATGQINAASAGGSGGYISTGGYGGTGSAAYFPQGLWSNGTNAWIYGTIYTNSAIYDIGNRWAINPAGNSWFNGGNVGIGTTAPNAALQIVKDSAGGELLRLSGYSPSPNGYYLSVVPVVGSNTVDYRFQTIDNIGGTKDMLYLDSSSGNIGVGNTAPAAKLDIVGEAKTRIAVTGNSGGIQIGTEANERPRIGFHVSNNNRRFKLEVNSINTVDERLGIFSNCGGGCAETEWLTINKSGNVGIGITAPTAKLEVAGQIKITGGTPGANKVLTSDASGLASWQTLGSGGGVIGGSGTQNYVPKFNNAAGTTIGNSQIFDNGTNVGIGMAPANKLHVAGSIGATGWIGAGCEGACEGGGGYSILYPEGFGILTAGLKVGAWEQMTSGNIKADGSITAGGGTINNPNSSYRWVGGSNWNTFYTPSGYIQIGPADSGWAHIYSDGKPFIFNTPVYSVANTFSSYNGDLLLQRAGTTILTVTASSARAPDFCTNSGKCLNNLSAIETDPVWNAQKASYATQAWVTGLGYTTQAWVQAQNYTTLPAVQSWVSGQNYIKDGSSVNSLTVNKLYVTTIDPIYEIDGKKYATYVADFSGGVRMETAGVFQIPQSKEVLISFNDLKKGSDLWLFWQASNKNINDLVVILTPGFNGQAWYEKQDNKIVIYGDRKGEVSYRLTLPRKDANEWPNKISK